MPDILADLRAVTKLPTPDVVRGLVDVLGDAIVGTIAAASNLDTVRSWLVGAAAPEAPQEFVLRVALRATSELRAYETKEVTTAWFMGINDSLQDTSVVEVLHELVQSSPFPSEAFEVAARDIVGAAAAYINSQL